MGSVAFMGVTLIFTILIGFIQIPLTYALYFISFGKIGLFSIYQCGIGFSGILFSYFIISIKLSRGNSMNFYGYNIPKWLYPFIQLIILSVLFHASFVGHLSGIILGLLWVIGCPGCFKSRHNLIKYIESLSILKCITNRNDFYASSQQPIINSFNLNFLSNNALSSDGSTYVPLNAKQYLKRGTALITNNNGNKNAKPMTIINGVLVPKDAQPQI